LFVTGRNGQSQGEQPQSRASLIPRVNLELLIQTAKKSLVSSFGKSGRIMCAKQLPSSGMRLLEGEVGMGHGHSWG
jgi:hypothetical protein